MAYERVRVENPPSLLSDINILKEMQKGNIIITSFDSQKLNSASYDVSLGDAYYREQRPENGNNIYSPWNEADSEKVWGSTSQHAEVALEFTARTGILLPSDIQPHNRIILISPHETILCHTDEFIGGKYEITSSMHARSSTGRNFIEVCKCAGLGDVGYINRWTMEVTNNSQYWIIPLVVGRRLSQIEFHFVGPTSKDYATAGKYQTSSDVDELMVRWKPEDMLPKMWKDREVKK